MARPCAGELGATPGGTGAASGGAGAALGQARAPPSSMAISSPVCLPKEKDKEEREKEKNEWVRVYPSHLYVLWENLSDGRSRLIEPIWSSHKGRICLLSPFRVGSAYYLHRNSDLKPTIIKNMRPEVRESCAARSPPYLFICYYCRYYLFFTIIYYA